MIITKITCDGCNKEIEPGMNRRSYYIEMLPIEYSEYPGNFHLPVMIHPPIEKKMQFHDLSCLIKWINKDKEIT